MLKLNLASHGDNMEGYVNIDFDHPTADLKADVADLPYEDETVDEIYASHIIEHFLSGDYEKQLAGDIYTKTAAEALTEWRRVLKPGGHLFIKTVDVDKVFWMKHNCPGWMCQPAANPPFPAWCDTLVSNHQHGCLFDKPVMAALLQQVGFHKFTFLDGPPKATVDRANIEMHVQVIK